MDAKARVFPPPCLHTPLNPAAPSTLIDATKRQPNGSHGQQGMTAAACWYRMWLLGSFTGTMVFTLACLSFGDHIF